MATTLIILDSQHPDAVLDHALTFSTWLETGDSLTDVSVTADLGITVEDGAKAPSIEGDSIVFWLSGGAHNQTYFGAVTVTTASGRTDIIEWQITIIDPNA
jgi:hypothetical protein